MRLEGKTLVLGVTGGIAAYKAPEIVRAFRAMGARVRVVLTSSAREFVTPLSLQTVAGEPVATELFDLTQESDIGHIDLADTADAILVAPATANCIAKSAAGLADDLLSTVLLATRAPIVVAPAMNVNMFDNALVQANLERLRKAGWAIVEPDEGSLACGYEGSGRLPDAEVLVEAVASAVAPKDLAGEVVVVTAGPTREYLDPVRFLSNRSSGKMGFALGRAACRRGAEVKIVAGPCDLPDPRGVAVVRVETAEEMAAAVRKVARSASIVIGAAAVADHRPAVRATEKGSKKSLGSRLALEATPDVIATAVPRRAGRFVLGFAAETTDVLGRARAKLEKKELDMIVANDVSAEGAGFDVDTNVVTLIDAQDSRQLPIMTKDEVAESILDRVLEIRPRKNKRGKRRSKAVKRR